MGVLDSSCVCEEDDAKVEPAMMNTTTRDEVAWIKAFKVRLVPASYQGLRILDEVATTALPSAEDMCTTPHVTILKVLCGVMQFWFDIDGQRATPAVFIPGFGSIFPKSRRRVTECCPPSKLSKFTHFYGL